VIVPLSNKCHAVKHEEEEEVFWDKLYRLNDKIQHVLDSYRAELGPTKIFTYHLRRGDTCREMTIEHQRRYLEDLKKTAVGAQLKTSTAVLLTNEQDGDYIASTLALLRGYFAAVKFGDEDLLRIGRREGLDVGDNYKIYLAGKSITPLARTLGIKRAVCVAQGFNVA